MTGTEITQIVIQVPQMPEPRKKASKGETPKKPAQMDWSCISCNNMMCLRDNFNLISARKRKSLPDACPLAVPEFNSKIQIDNLLRTNKALKSVRVAIREFEESLKNLRIEESTLAQQRHRQLRQYYQKITVTRIIEKKRKKKPVTPLPNFTVTVSEVQNK